MRLAEMRPRTLLTQVLTVNAVLVAITDAARLIRLGEASVVVAGGQESMTQAPLLMPGARAGHPYGNVEMLDHAANDGLTDAFDHDSMGASTERFNARYGMTRILSRGWPGPPEEDT